EEDLKGDVRFVELLAQFVGAARQIRRLEQQQAGLSQFFSPTVMETLTGDKAHTLLEPRECDITVLFCDVRGFSRRAELAQHSLHELLGRVSNALGVMTRGIVLHEGVIADFQGDSALAFWGWPVPPDEGPADACRAALCIHSGFRQATGSPDHALADFRVGIGIAHGRAIAGKIGSAEQAKVGVFGPVVNLGSRLEGLTKLFQASILMDESTAAYVRAHLPATEGRCRRLARIKPFGMETVLTITELLPPASPDSTITDAEIATYETALDAVIEGRWPQAFDLLSELPVRDRAKEFLMILLAEHNYQPPADWNGTIVMTGK
ncbi:MAG TPA: adenylate/guanylate cyclase domain-containing protein, partial [Planctomycetaceae bacterium]